MVERQSPCDAPVVIAPMTRVVSSGSSAIPVDARQPILALHGVSCTVPTGRGEPPAAIDGVDLHVHAGEFVLVSGESGGSLTALLAAASGLSRPSTGKVLLSGADFWALSRASRNRLRAARIALLRAPVSSRRALIPRGPKVAASVAAQGAWPVELRRDTLIQALTTSPGILIAEEPARDLDEAAKSEIMGLLRRLNEDEGLTILLACRDRSLSAYATRVVFLQGGLAAQDPAPARTFAAATR